jgi:hypothetical protein
MGWTSAVPLVNGDFNFLKHFSLLTRFRFFWTGTSQARCK